MVAVVGFAFLVTVVTPCGKRVFLLAVSTIPTVMHGMTPAATTVKKAALGRSKSPPLAVKKVRLFAGTKNEYIICTISFQGAYINRGSDICNLMDKQ